MHEGSKYVVAIAVGGLMDGFTLVGPFDFADEATVWAGHMVKDASWDVVEIEAPDEVA